MRFFSYLLCEITIFAENEIFFGTKISLLGGYVTAILADLKHDKVIFYRAKVFVFFFTPCIIKKIVLEAFFYFFASGAYRN